MSIHSSESFVQFTRGVFHANQLESYVIPLMTFPFMSPISDLKEMARRLERNAPKDEFHIPWRGLNDALHLLCARLSHPFISNRRATEHSWDQIALGLPQSVHEARRDPISAEHLRKLVFIWLELVVVPKFFKDKGRAPGVQDALRKAQEQISRSEVEWDYITLDEIFKRYQQGDLSRRAISSLLSHLFVQRAADDKYRWRLAREDSGLIVVSRVFTHQGISFAYTLSPIVRWPYGSEQAHVYFMPRRRRYLSQPLKHATKARVMVEIARPLLSEDEISNPIQVPVKLTRNTQKGSLNYSGTLLPMLHQFIGSNVLPDASTLLEHPSKADKASGLLYHVVHHNKMNPPLKKGHIGLRLERIRQLHDLWHETLGDFIHPLAPMPIHPLGVVDKQWVKKRKLSALASPGTPAFRKRILPRLRLALQDAALSILIFAEHEMARSIISDEIRRTLGLENEELPPDLEIRCIPTPRAFQDDLLSLDSKGWTEDLRKVSQEIHKLKLPPNRAYFAILERPPLPESEDRARSDQKKSVLRAAFGQQGIVSQMILPFDHSEETGLQHRKGRPYQKSDRSRLKSAVGDLLTSSGVIGGALSNVYRVLGFDEEIASSLVVDYWMRYKRYEPSIKEYAIARQHPDGRIEILLPDHLGGVEGKPLSAHQAASQLQKKLKVKGSKAKPDQDQQEVIAFFNRSLVTPLNHPRLIVVRAEDWRSEAGLDWLSDARLRQDGVKIGGQNLDLAKLPQVRMVMTLMSEDNNMRYWLTTDPNKIKGMVAVHDTTTNLPRIYSIDARPMRGIDEEAFDQDDGEKYSAVMEISGLLFQPEDDTPEQRLRWLLIPHLLRRHPIWNKEEKAIRKPYPQHVVHKLFDDACWAIFINRE